MLTVLFPTGGTNIVMLLWPLVSSQVVFPLLFLAGFLVVATFSSLWSTGAIDPTVIRASNGSGAIGIQEYRHGEFGDVTLALLSFLAAALVACWRPLAIRRRCWPSMWALVDRCRRGVAVEATTCGQGRRRRPRGRGDSRILAELAALLLALLVALALVALALGFGLLNRIRGGWVGSLSVTLPGSDDADLLRRLLFDVPCGVVVAALSGCPELGAAFALLMYFGNLPGWGCYFSMAHGLPELPPGHGDCADDGARYGMFDWALGRPTFEATAHGAAAWEHSRLYARDWAAMSMRGIVWLGPPGILLLSADFGPLFLLSGVTMAAVYEIGHDVSFPAATSGTPLATFLGNFGKGTPMAELLWGVAVAAWLLLALLGGRAAALWRRRHCCPAGRAESSSSSSSASSQQSALWPCCAWRRSLFSEVSSAAAAAASRGSSLSRIGDSPVKGLRDEALSDGNAWGSMIAPFAAVDDDEAEREREERDIDYLDRRRNVSLPMTEDGMPWRTHSMGSNDTLDGESNTAARSLLAWASQHPAEWRCRVCLRAFGGSGGGGGADVMSDAGSDDNAAAVLGLCARVLCGRVQHDRDPLWRPSAIAARRSCRERGGCSRTPPHHAETSVAAYYEEVDDAEIASEVGDDTTDAELWLSVQVRCCCCCCSQLRARHRALSSALSLSRPPSSLTLSLSHSRSPPQGSRRPVRVRYL